MVDWFQNTLDLNTKNAIEQFKSKADEIFWREVKLESAIKYREAGFFSLSNDEFEKIISEQIEILSKVK